MSRLRRGPAGVALLPILLPMLLPVLLASGCGLLPEPPRQKPVSSYHADMRDIEGMRRVMVLPFDLAPAVHADARPVRQAFISELAKIQLFELVPLPDGAGEDRVLYETLKQGRMSAEALVALGKRYQLDGVLLGTLTGYRAYKPQHLGLHIQLVSVHTGSVVWAVEGFYDTTDASTIEDLEHYSRSFMAEDDSMHGWHINLISPGRFASYVCHRLVGTWR